MQHDFKITNHDLERVYSQAKTELLNTAKHRSLEPHQFVVLCYLKAVASLLQVPLDLSNYTNVEQVRNDD